MDYRCKPLAINFTGPRDMLAWRRYPSIDPGIAKRNPLYPAMPLHSRHAGLPLLPPPLAERYTTAAGFFPALPSSPTPLRSGTEPLRGSFPPSIVAILVVIVVVVVVVISIVVMMSIVYLCVCVSGLHVHLGKCAFPMREVRSLPAWRHVHAQYDG